MRRILQSVMVLTMILGLASSAQAQTETFDFNIAASDWSGNVDQPSTSGNYSITTGAPGVGGANPLPEQYIMQLDGGGNLVMFHGQNADGPHQIQAAFTIQDVADVNQTFTVTSLDFTNTAGTDEDSHIVGYSGGDMGTVEWMISGTQAGTLTAPTTGSFANPIDTMRWETVGATYRDEVFGATLDNLVIEIDAGVLLGDVNLDGTVDFLDISPFIAVLSGTTNQAEADCDMSGTVDFLDISPFIAILSGP